MKGWRGRARAMKGADKAFEPVKNAMEEEFAAKGFHGASLESRSLLEALMGENGSSPVYSKHNECGSI